MFLHCRYIYERSAKHGKRVQCNMGAKNHAVIMPDADVDSTVKALTGKHSPRHRRRRSSHLLVDEFILAD